MHHLARGGTRAGRVALVTATAVVVLGSFVAIICTFPWRSSSAPSRLTIRALPLSQWGFGQFHSDSSTMPSSGYVYGPVLARRIYMIAPLDTHRDPSPESAASTGATRRR